MPKSLPPEITTSQAVDAAAEMIIRIIRELAAGREDREVVMLELVAGIVKSPDRAAAEMAIISRALEMLEEE